MMKRYLSTALLGVFLVVIAAAVANREVYNPVLMQPEAQVHVQTIEETYQEALKGGADLCFWYDDSSYDTYFTTLAAEYYKETGILVELIYKEVMDYVGDIHDSTMQEEAFPDVFLLSGEELEKAHLYGIAGENELAEVYMGNVAENAVTASVCHGKMFGYPLSYNVCLLTYNNQYFATAPESLQAIIDYSDENEPAENVQYLLEWDAYDPFFGFLFVSDSIVLSDEAIGVLEASYDEALLEE